MNTAFSDNPQLQRQINKTLTDEPPTHAQQELLTAISHHVIHLHTRIAGLTSQVHALNATSTLPHPLTNGTDGAIAGDVLPPSKKRKCPTSEGAADDETTRWRHGPALFTARDVSFSMPMRKKLALEIVGDKEGGVRVVDLGKKETEAGMGWADIEQIFALPVPEKATAQTNFVVVPKSSSTSSATAAAGGIEPLVWTVPSTGAPKNWAVQPPLTGADFGLEGEDTCVQTLEKILSKITRTLVKPDAREFVSNVVQSHRKGERNYHVKAWKGSKEGYLYLLPPGILFGFRKPLLYFPFSSITSISYTSILQRTFNLVLSTTAPDGTEDEDIEFSMLDQADFAPLDAYVKRHGLHDASLAGARRAKTHASGIKREGGNADPDEEEDEVDALGANLKAEKELQDREDEEEEDFAPSGSDDGGSGSESGSEEEDGDEAEDGAEGAEEGEEEEEAGGGGHGHGRVDEDGYELDEDDAFVVDHSGGRAEDEGGGRAKRRRL